MKAECKKIGLKEAGEFLLEPENKHIAIAVHTAPDGDCLGSALGLGIFLKSKGKSVTLLADDHISATYAFLPGIEAFQHLENYEEIKADLLCVLDAGSLERIGKAAAVKAKRYLNIDHHGQNSYFADRLYQDTKAAATGEILWELFDVCGWAIDKTVATCLYTAIVTDCGFFRYGNTTPKTMRAAAALLGCGIDPAYISDSLEMKTTDSVRLLAKVLAGLSFAADGRIAYISVPHELYDPEAQTDSFINYPRYIFGVEAAAYFKAVGPGTTRVSLRSRDLDVAAVAAGFGGGGHLRAAGCTIEEPLEQAQKKMLAALEAALKKK